MTITETQIREIVRDVLNEALTDKVYHFTNYSALYGIIADNAIKLQHTMSKISDDNTNKIFYLSLTRNRNSEQGYSKNYTVRIEFDGRKLNQKFSGGAFNYWGKEMGKNAYMNKTATDGASIIPYVQHRTENEDRLVSDEPFIYDIYKYITRIDVLIEDNIPHDLVKIIQYKCSSLVNFYNNKKDFNFQSNNTVSIESILDSYNYSHDDDISKDAFIDRRKQQALISLFKIIKYKEYTPEEIVNYASRELRKHNLEQYLRSVIKKVAIFRYEDFDMNSLDDIYQLPSSDYKQIMSILIDYCKERNIHGIKDLLLYKRKLQYNQYIDNNHIYSKILDYDKKINVIVLKPSIDSKYRKYVILHPEKITINDVRKETYFFNDINTILYNIKWENDYDALPKHNSKSNESFLQYCKYIFLKKQTLDDVIKIMSLFTYEKQKEIFGCVVCEESIDVMHQYDYEFINDNDKKELRKQFIDYNKSIN